MNGQLLIGAYTLMALSELVHNSSSLSYPEVSIRPRKHSACGQWCFEPQGRPRAPHDKLDMIFVGLKAFSTSFENWGSHYVDGFSEGRHSFRGTYPPTKWSEISVYIDWINKSDVKTPAASACFRGQ